MSTEAGYRKPTVLLLAPALPAQSVLGEVSEGAAEAPSDP
jgi:hypothetical protein